MVWFAKPGANEKPTPECPAKLDASEKAYGSHAFLKQHMRSVLIGSGGGSR